MAFAKLSVVVPLILFLLHSAAAAPISGPEASSSISGGVEQKRGYDGDWLYSRQSAGTQGGPQAEGSVSKRVAVSRVEEQKRGYDGDWLFSRIHAAAADLPNAN